MPTRVLPCPVDTESLGEGERAEASEGPCPVPGLGRVLSCCGLLLPVWPPASPSPADAVEGLLHLTLWHCWFSVWRGTVSIKLICACRADSLETLKCVSGSLHSDPVGGSEGREFRVSRPFAISIAPSAMWTQGVRLTNSGLHGLCSS